MIGMAQAFAQGQKKVNKDELIGITKKVEAAAIADTTDGWETGGTIALNISNVGLQNWAAGGSNSYSLTGLVGLFANYTEGKSSWDNNIDLGLGAIKQFLPGADASEVPWVKSDDKLDFTSKYGQQASEKWFYSGLLNFKSQFLPGFNDPYLPDSSRKTISNFLAPAYGIAAIGMDFKPNKEVTMFVAPFTAKATIVADEDLNAVGGFGVDSGQVWRIEYGVYLRLMYKKEIAKNVTFNSKFEWFQNYQRIEHIDINWETLTSMKVNEFISATLTTQLIYDDDILIAVDENRNGTIDGNAEHHARTQFKHVLGVGLTYKF